MAPEVVRHERYSMKCDVYSFAIVLYEIFEGIIVAQNAAAFAAGAAGPQHKRPECVYLPAMNQKRTALMEGLIQRCWCAGVFLLIMFSTPLPSRRRAVAASRSMCRA